MVNRTNLFFFFGAGIADSIID